MPTLTKPKPSSAFKTWSKRIPAFDGGAEVTKTIIGALKRIITLSRRDLAADTELHKLVDYRFNHENSLPARGAKAVRWKLTGEQTTQGLMWLRRPRLLKTLDPQDLIVLDDFSHFLFVGFEIEDHTRHAGFPQIIAKPVYRVVGKDGRWFDYSSSPWRSGRESFTVLARGK
jgi:hypothetical protein